MEQAPPSALDALLHRWLVEYNPLYLFSATLVLGGLTAISREMAQTAELWGIFGVPAVAELYTFALIGGAAFLVRTGHRRPAAMLGLLAAIFMGDVTLHVEACAYLGAAGVVAAAIWAFLFVVKLRCLAWALELRLSRSALLVPSGAAVGLAALPLVLQSLDPAGRAAVVALWLFGVAIAGLWTARTVESSVPFDIRARRCIRAAWAIWAVLVVGHTLYWSATFHFSLLPACLLMPLFWIRFMRREAWAWIIAALTLAVAATAPAWFAIVAIGAALSLGVLALRGRLVPVAPDAPSPGSSPYRTFDRVDPAVDLWIRVVDPSARTRLLAGAAGTLATIPFHAAARAGLIPTPTSTLEWGLAAIGTGFVTLLASLATTWHVGRRRRA